MLDLHRIVLFEAFTDFREYLFIFFQFPEIFVGLSVFVGISPGQVAGCEFESLEVNISQTLGCE